MTGCSVDKYLQPGQRVLYDNKVNVSMADSSAVPDEVTEALAGVKQYFYQKPNRRILWMPVLMKIYCLSNPDKDNWWNNVLRSNGEPPVVYDRVAAQRTASQLATLLKTKGCFNSVVTTDTVHLNGSSLTVNYNVRATQRHFIDDLVFVCRQKDINDLLQQWKGDSYLKVGDYYDQQKMTDEQTRLVNNLKGEGYYYASPDNIRFIVDTTSDNRALSITVIVRSPQGRGRDTASTVVLHKYHIDNILIYPNVSTAIDLSRQHFDTLVYPYTSRHGVTNFYYIYNNKISPSPRAISRAMFLFHNMTYRPRFVNYTTNSLLGLHNFKYVDINFEESPNSTDSNHLLDARIRLLNSPRHRLSLSFELTNASNFSNKEGNFFTSGNLGLGTTLGYQNNNIFGGAERLSIEGDLIFDLPKNVFTSANRDFHNTFSAFEMGLNTSLDLPDFLMPFTQNIDWQTSKPHTLVELNANYLYRNLFLPEYDNGQTQDVTLERVRFGGSFGYTWSNNRNVKKHKLLPFNLSYSHLLSGEKYYDYLYRLTSDAQFRFQSVDYVLLNTHYEYTYSNQNIGTRNNFNYLRFSVETAGNLLNAVDRLIHGPRQATDDDIQYCQYFRFDSEFKRYIYWGDKATLVLRSLVGFGIPYGHSTFIPYEKTFVGGGPTTMRGWALRHLSYGQYTISGTDVAIGVGNIQLVGNIEHRFPIVGIFEGAVFTDFGNVWMYDDWGIGPASTFQPSKILKSIALDAGIGIRANISVVTLRIDVALPLYDPGYGEGERWLHSHWSWNQIRNQISTHFGINYPF